ncbi:MAG: protein kinase domain-containing protein [Nannocystaceae bacterium]|nr:serine/threonine-protein kinase [bacterium]
MDDEPKDSDASDATEPGTEPSTPSEDSGIVRAVLTGGANVRADGPDEAPAPGDLVRGTTVGSYVILSQLSGDDDDSVYAAFDARSDRKVALKVIEVGDDDDDDAQSRREAMIAGAMRSGSVDHPGIVAVRDAGTVGRAVYVAMEFIDGIDLRQWMEARDEPFPWPEVLRVFREAGAGLAAAHAAGCVHGDFTPSRVFMEKSGRICVFDFGLATPAAEVSSPGLTMKSLEEGLGAAVTHSGSKALDDAGEDSVLEGLPRAELVGTPRYLAPEVHAGMEPDAKADQFAFCAAMYEALYGEVPFVGDSPATIAKAALGHAVRPAPQDSDVPQWLREVLVKGLSPRRRDRYGSMEVLLRELEHDPKGRRRRWVAGVGVLVGAAAVASVIALLLEREASRCEADAALLEGAWDSDTRASIEAAFMATTSPRAADSWDAVQTSMDDWTEQWLEYRALACTVRQVDDDEAMFARRNACLEGVLQPFAAFAGSLAEGDASAGPLSSAQRVVNGLWRPADCRAPDMLDYAAPSEEGGTRDVDRAWFLLLAGEHDAARALATEVAARTSGVEHTRTSVRARLIAGLAAGRAGAPDAANLLHEAASVAAAAGLRIPQAEAWIALARYETIANQPSALAHAQTLVDAIKIDRLRAQLLMARGARQRVMGRDRDALDSYHRALALLPDDDTRATILRSDILLELGELAGSREEWKTASQYLAEVLAIRERTFGPAHPELIEALGAHGHAQLGLGLPTDAQRSYDRALVIAKQTDPAPTVISELQTAMGRLEASRGQHTLAASHYDEAVRVLEGTGADAMLAEALLGLGLARLDAGTPSRATPPLERAAVLASRVGWTENRRSRIHEALGRSLVQSDPSGALQAYRKALRSAPAADAQRLERAIEALTLEVEEPDDAP